MGPLGKVLEMFPGMSGKITDETAQAGEQEIKYLEAIINSMTQRGKSKTRTPHSNSCQKAQTIAAGSGTDVPRVNRVLKQYKQMKEMMKMLGGKGKGSKRRRRMPFKSRNAQEYAAHVKQFIKFLIYGEIGIRVFERFRR